MTRGDIIAFSKDWTDDPTSNTHILQSLAGRGWRVLWLNSITMRRPDIGSSRDLRRIFRKLREALKGPRQVQRGLYTLTPVLLPVPRSAAGLAVNRRMLGFTVRRAAMRIGINRPQLWSFLPTGAEYCEAVSPHVVVYYCTDNWRAMPSPEGTRLQKAEEGWCARADVVFATSEQLAVQLKRAVRANVPVKVLRHGVDFEHFASALQDGVKTPSALAGIRYPIIGLMALVDWRVDLELLVGIARDRPGWNIVIAGEVLEGRAELKTLENVHILGRYRYSMLPGLLNKFNVGLIPFKINDYTVAINPIKLREYLAAGVPVVSSDLPEVRGIERGVRIAAGVEGFVRAIEASLEEGSVEERKKRSEAMRGESWDARASEIEVMLGDALGARARVTGA